MGKEKGCVGCANNVGGMYCTMQKDMNRAKYAFCDGRKVLPPAPKKKKVWRPKADRIRVKDDSYFASEFMKFVKKGGSWSSRTGEWLIKE